MTTHELNIEQLNELKQNYLCERFQNASYMHLANPGIFVSDRTIHERFAGVDFGADDFCCSTSELPQMPRFANFSGLF